MHNTRHYSVTRNNEKLHSDPRHTEQRYSVTRNNAPITVPSHGAIGGVPPVPSHGTHLDNSTLCDGGGGSTGQAAYLTQALRDAHLVELRYLGPYGVHAGLFNSLEPLQAAVEQWGKTGNLYTSLNRPASLRPGNAMRKAGQGITLRDQQIDRIMRLPFDFDPVRPTGTASTDDELQAAIDQRNRFVDAMLALGWPMPALASSGNGAHAVFRVSLPNDRATTDMLRLIYQGMRHEFSTDEVLFDPTVRNASRIWRLYGSVNRKGEPTVDRPHRVAEVALPSRWNAVSPDQVRQLAHRYQTEQEHHRRVEPQGPAVKVGGKGDFRTLDVVRWFTAHGMYRRDLGSGKHAVVCPWDDEHSSRDPDFSAATVVWEATGNWPNFHCSHAHCDGRGIRDVMNKLGDADAHCARQFKGDRDE